MNPKHKANTLYDVYVSYPPNTDYERVNEFIRSNLSEQEANDIISSLAEYRQAIIAESCSNEERENAQHYFSYLGLDVIVRRSLELAPEANGDPDATNTSDPIPQCPVCYTIFEDPDTKQCPCCKLIIGTATEEQIQHRRIEWQERMAFESRKQHEIAYKLWREKQEEEKPTEAIIATTPDAVNTPIRNECTNIFPEDDMDRLRKKMISQSSDEKMLSAAKKLEFLEAARLRDELIKLEDELAEKSKS